jgi:hypothetical protein
MLSILIDRDSEMKSFLVVKQLRAKRLRHMMAD